MAKKKGGRRVKKQTQKQTEQEDTEWEAAPKCFVFGKGKIGAPLKALVADMKQVMSPNTARALRWTKRNKLRDFVHVAGQLKVSFFLIVSTTETASYLRLVRAPRGPTLTFKVDAYSLVSDVKASLRRPQSAGAGVWQSAPLLVLSGFDANVQEEKLMSTMLQNLFPTINAATMQINACRRVLLIHKRPANEGGSIELRQYMIKATPTGVSRGVKKLVRNAQLPSLGRYADVSDYLLGGKNGGYSSDSAGETDDEEKAELPQATHAAKAGQKARRTTTTTTTTTTTATTTTQPHTLPPASCSAPPLTAPPQHPPAQVSIKLHELGPRLQMSLLKVQEGLCDGATLYHALVSKSEDEVAQTAARRKGREEARAARREEQEGNVERKRAAEAEKWERKKRRREERLAGGGAAGSEAGDDEEDDEDDEEDEEDEGSEMDEGSDDGDEGGEGGEGEESGEEGGEEGGEADDEYADMAEGEGEDEGGDEDEPEEAPPPQRAPPPAARKQPRQGAGGKRKKSKS